MWAKIGQWVGTYIIPKILEKLFAMVKEWHVQREDRLRREKEAKEKAAALQAAKDKEEARRRFEEMP